MPGYRETNTSTGQVQLILGPMFSGKSTELIRRLKRYQVAKYEVLIIKYAKDVRYDENGISTHDRQTLPAVAATTLQDLTKKAMAYDVIGIDEGQFFPDITWVEEMANKGKVVLIAALDGTFQRKPFSSILELIPLAESVTKLSAVCMNCFGEAAFSKRISEEDSLEVIGGADKYMAVCRKCYLSPCQIATSPREHLKTQQEMDAPPPKKMLFSPGAAEKLGPYAA